MDTPDKINTREADTDNPHDKGYKRIFSIKKNFLNFIKKYVALEWMMALTEDDLNEWVTRKLNEAERSEFIKQLREGDEEAMCSSFERILNKEKAEGRESGKAEGRELGRAEGKVEDIIELLEDIGKPSEALRKCIMEQKDLEVLKRWHKKAARAGSIEEFEQAVGLVQM